MKVPLKLYVQYKVPTKSVQHKLEMISPVQPTIDGKKTSEVEKRKKTRQQSTISPIYMETKYQ